MRHGHARGRFGVFLLHSARRLARRVDWLALARAAFRNSSPRTPPAMFDLKLLRDDPDRLRAACRAKHVAIDFDHLLALDQERRDLIRQVEQGQAEVNAASKQIGARIKAGEDPEAAKAHVRKLKDDLEAARARQNAVQEEFAKLCLWVPNPPHPTTPPGRGEEDNQTIATWGEAPKFDFAPKPHWEIAEKLGILDLARGTKLAGSGFFVLKGAGAKLERALINWFIDVHTTEFGCTEIWPPHVVNSATMLGTGQLPKMAGDMYRVGGLGEGSEGAGAGAQAKAEWQDSEDLWLIPTAEVPVTNLYRDEILDAAQLPLYHCAWTPCFRREAGSYGKEVRGITRVHQFDKVEVVKFVRPETGDAEHEALTRQAETLLERLGLHYRRLLLCAGDISFAASKCHDLEVWAPGMDRFLEVSSCSTFGDFQARRANIRFRPAAGEKPQFVHTLNGSGLALPRTVIAILENYQQSDGSVVVPDVLRPFMGCDVIK
jgi:seryl-tRNA synthetase